MEQSGRQAQGSLACLAISAPNVSSRGRQLCANFAPTLRQLSSNFGPPETVWARINWLLSGGLLAGASSGPETSGRPTRRQTRENTRARPASSSREQFNKRSTSGRAPVRGLFSSAPKASGATGSGRRKQTPASRVGGRAWGPRGDLKSGRAGLAFGQSSGRGGGATRRQTRAGV